MEEIRSGLRTLHYGLLFLLVPVFLLLPMQNNYVFELWDAPRCAVDVQGYELVELKLEQFWYWGRFLYVFPLTIPAIPQGLLNILLLVTPILALFPERLSHKLTYTTAWGMVAAGQLGLVLNHAMFTLQIWGVPAQVPTFLFGNDLFARCHSFVPSIGTAFAWGTWATLFIVAVGLGVARIHDGLGERTLKNNSVRPEMNIR